MAAGGAAGCVRRVLREPTRRSAFQGFPRISETWTSWDFRILMDFDSDFDSAFDFDFDFFF